MEAEAKEALILRLFRAYPGGANSVSRSTIEVYLKAVDFFSVPLIAEAVERFSMGMVDRKSRSFVPSADELATEIRNVRFEHGNTNRLLSQGLKQIEAREREDAEIEAARTPESMARVRSLMEQFKQDTNPDKRTPEEVAEAQARLMKMDERFHDEFWTTANELKISRTLATQLGWTTEPDKGADN